jgi:hypothetical protein
MMTTAAQYVFPVGDLSWLIAGQQDTAFTWEYADSRKDLLALYEKSKRQQWNASERIDWSQELSPENPMELPDDQISIYGSEIWRKLSEAQKVALRRHTQAWNISQFLHGEQGALIGAAKIIQQLPSLDAKLCAATQVVDEARHAEAFARLLHEKFDLAYPIMPPLRSLLKDVVGHKEWDFTYLGIQVIIEGAGLAAFQTIRDKAQNPLAVQVNAFVMQDEARHVAFGRLELRDYYPKLSQAEREQREEFVIDACYLMRDRMMPTEVWDALGLDIGQCKEVHMNSSNVQRWSTRLFSRIVPTVRDIGLWGPRVRRAFESMGVIHFALVDTDDRLSRDDHIAEALGAASASASASVIATVSS